MPKDKQIKLDPMEWKDAMKNIAPAPGKGGKGGKMKKAAPAAKKAPAKKR